jgi:alkylation response protein AidB-like acyl-CoA dehydrogenase
MPQRSSFLVSARKRSITNLGEAAVILLSARRDDAPHDRSIAAFAMPADAPGCYQRRGADRMGLRSSPTGDLIARNVTVPTPSLLGDGLEFFRMCFALERLTVGALYVGAMRRALRRVTAHLERRTELRSYQYVQQRVVAIRSALAFTESLLFRTRTMWLAGDPCEVELSVLKGHGAESALGATGEVVRVLGARGYEAAGGAEKDARDMLGLTFLGGTAELHKNVVFASALKGQ